MRSHRRHIVFLDREHSPIVNIGVERGFYRKHHSFAHYSAGNSFQQQRAIHTANVGRFGCCSHWRLDAGFSRRLCVWRKRHRRITGFCRRTKLGTLFVDIQILAKQIFNNMFNTQSVFLWSSVIDDCGTVSAKPI